MRLAILSIIILSGIFILSACKKDDKTIVKEKLSGYVQKGPFINGTSIIINELEKDLSQTGKSFNSQIIDNRGSFAVNNIELASDFISLRADGFYFNEILGQQSSSQITLHALSNIADRNTINVNILSHLEKSRIEYLVSQGQDFNQAKTQAQKEVLSIFEIDYSAMEESESLNIAQEGEHNAILLATSVILQGYRSESELTELLSDISSDIREDGILNNSTLGSKIINHSVFLDTLEIRTNLENRYNEIDLDAVIPDFEKYISNFLQNTSYQISESIFDYPEQGIHGQNILDVNRTVFNSSVYSLAVNTRKGTKLKIKISALGEGIWMYQSSSSINWGVTTFDQTNRCQFFTVIESGKSCDLNMIFNSGEYLIEYFEMENSEPTISKQITVE